MFGWRTSYQNTTLSPTDPTLKGLRFNLGFSSEGLATNRLGPVTEKPACLQLQDKIRKWQIHPSIGSCLPNYTVSQFIGL